MVSEFMLQQTQVQTVIPYYHRFMQRFPTLAILAQARLDDVLAVWSGLGYYRRARHLHQTAQIVWQYHQGEVPTDFSALLQLPGIGRSTAGAILALALDAPYSILDGNVKRILVRYHAISGNTEIPAINRQLWLLAESHLPPKRVRDYTQALMDLGSLVCVRGKPACQQCPLVVNCLAYQQGNPHQYPTPKKSSLRPTKEVFFLILQNERDEILLEKRHHEGIWGGLWSLPECALTQSPEHFCLDQFRCHVLSHHALPVLQHTLTHLHLVLHPVHLLVIYDKLLPDLDPRWRWHLPSQVMQLALPAPIRFLMQQMGFSDLSLTS